MGKRAIPPRADRWFPNLSGLTDPHVEQAFHRAFDYIYQLQATTTKKISISRLDIGINEQLPGGVVSAIRNELSSFGRAPLNLSKLPGVGIDTKKIIADAQNFNYDMVFSATDFNTVAWTAGTLEFNDGSTFAIAAGNTGNMSALTYIYFDTNASITALQTTTVRSTAVGPGKTRLAHASAASAADQDAFFVPVVGVLGVNATHIGPNSITTGMVQALAITTSELAANSVTAVKINVATLSAITADVGDLTAGTITGVTITGGVLQTAAPGNDRISITSASQRVIQFLNAADNLIGQLVLVASGNHLQVVTTSLGGDLQLTSTVGAVEIRGANALGVTFLVTGARFELDVNMNTNDILNAGDIECDSLTKDGAGDILFNDNIDMGTRSIINVGQIELVSIAKDGAGDVLMADNLDMGGLNIVNAGDVELDSLTKDGGGQISVNHAFDMNANNVLDVGVLECDVLSSAPSGGTILVSDNMRPDVDDSFHLGTSSLKWSDVQTVLLNGADICLLSGWKFREWPAKLEDIHTKSTEWFRRYADKGIQILDKKEKLIAVIHGDGYIYCKGTRPLEELKS